MLRRKVSVQVKCRGAFSRGNRRTRRKLISQAPRESRRRHSGISACINFNHYRPALSAAVPNYDRDGIPETYIRMYVARARVKTAWRRPAAPTEPGNKFKDVTRLSGCAVYVSTGMWACRGRRRPGLREPPRRKQPESVLMVAARPSYPTKIVSPENWYFLNDRALAAGEISLVVRARSVAFFFYFTFVHFYLSHLPFSSTST